MMMYFWKSESSLFISKAMRITFDDTREMALY